MQRNLRNDVLVAATTGATLITANRADFDLIDSVVGFSISNRFLCTTRVNHGAAAANETKRASR
jgi:hypothetical protein